jgi:hypothetical protein
MYRNRCLNMQKRVPWLFPKSKSHFKVLGIRKEACGNNADRRIWGANVKNIFTQATWRLGFAHPRAEINCFIYLLPRFAWLFYLYFNLRQKKRPCFIIHGATVPSWPGTPHYRGHTITPRHTTLGRTPLDELSAQRRYSDHIWHSQLTYIHDSGGIRTRNPGKQAAADPRLRSCSQGLGESPKGKVKQLINILPITLFNTNLSQVLITTTYTQIMSHYR